MIDLALTTLLVSAVVVVSRLWGGLRVLTAITLGLVVGWLYSGYVLGSCEEYDAFDSGELAGRRWCYALFSTLAVLALALHLLVAAWREAHRRPRPKPATPR